MRRLTTCLSRLALVFLLSGFTGATAHAQDKPVTGMIYTHTARAGTTVTQGGGNTTASPLDRGAVFSATAQTIDVPASQMLMLVLSNGNALCMPQGGKLTLQEFTQLPLKDAPVQHDYEPTQSSLRMDLAQGSLAIYTRESKPTSSTTISTPLAQLKCNSRSMVVQVQNDSITVTVFAGTVVLTATDTKFSETLQTGQSATLTKQSLHDAYPLKLASITEGQTQAMQSWLNAAQLAESRINFTPSATGLQVKLTVPVDFTHQMSVDDPNFR